MCRKCPQPAQAGRKLCVKCGERNRAYLAQYRANHPEQHRAKANAARTSRVKAGICAQAGCGAETGGSSLCSAHGKRDRDRWFKSYGHGCTRREEITAQKQRQVMLELSQSPVLSQCWTEVKGWVAEHIELWIEPSVGVLGNYIEIGGMEL